MQLDSQVLADGAIRYASLSTDTWGLGGSVTRYEYDANGSVIRKVTSGANAQTVEYAYTLQNRLASVTSASTNQSQVFVARTLYAYDPAGNRVRSESHASINGVESSAATNIFLVNPASLTGYPQVLEELPAVGSRPVIAYTVGIDMISQTKSGGESTTDFFLRDGHGSVRQLADMSGVISANYAYDAYGPMLGGNPSVAQPAKTAFLYAGEQFDSALQQYYLRARYYDQGTGRFASIDPFFGTLQDPQSLHRYAYCQGDPVNAIDPSGQQLLDVAIYTALITILAGIGLWYYTKPAIRRAKLTTIADLYPSVYADIVNASYGDESVMLLTQFKHWFDAYYDYMAFKEFGSGGKAPDGNDKWACADHAVHFAEYLVKYLRAPEHAGERLQYLRLKQLSLIEATLPFLGKSYLHTWMIADNNESGSYRFTINFDSWQYFDSAPNYHSPLPGSTPGVDDTTTKPGYENFNLQQYKILYTHPNP
jgi:RHS repeat-associated protein